MLAGFAYLWWGFFPLYWHFLHGVSSLTILAHRIVWSLALVIAWLIYRQELGAVIARMKSLRTVALCLTTGLLLMINWNVYVWGIAEHRVLETSLGYFINPLVNVFLGTVLLKEKLRRMQWLSVAIAFAGVCYASVLYGVLPWVAMVLALSFGSYGLIRKMNVGLGPMEGLGLELLICLPIAFVLFGISQDPGRALPGFDSSKHVLLLLGAGFITLLPLVAFAVALKHMNYSTMGLIQYVAPSCQFLLAIFFFHESVSIHRWVSFTLIWLALAVLTVDLLHQRRLSLRPSAA